MLLNPCARRLSSSAWVTTGLPHDVSSAPVESNVLPRFQPGCIAATAATRSVGGCVVVVGGRVVVVGGRVVVVGGRVVVVGGRVVVVGLPTVPVQTVPL